MKMLSLSIVSGLFLTAILPAANAATGTISLSAAVTPTTCVVPANQLTRTITLPAMTSASLAGKADGEKIVNQDMAFTFTGCETGLTGVGVKFDFTKDGDYLTNTGDAEGVKLAITDSGDTKIDTGDTIPSADYDSATGTGSVNAKVWAYRVGTAAPVGGSISSTATVTVVTN